MLKHTLSTAPANTKKIKHMLKHTLNTAQSNTNKHQTHAKIHI